MALKFVNHASSIGAYCAMVVGANFKRTNVLDKVNKTYKLLHQEDLGEIKWVLGHTRKVKCCFCIWGPNGEVTPTPVALPFRYKNGEWGGDWSIVLPTDPSANLLVKRWGNVGDVTKCPTKINLKVDSEIIKQEQRRRKKNYGSNYTTGRTCSTDFFIKANNVEEVANTFTKAKINMRSLVKEKTTGNNPSITIPDLIKGYIAARDG